jgi:hypothetical protein
MFPANTHTIRLATEDDAETLRRLAEIDSQPQLTGRVLIAEVDDTAIAALALDDRRAVADPFRKTGGALALLRMRASGMTSYERTPSLRDRIRAATRVTHGSLAHAEG